MITDHADMQLVEVLGRNPQWVAFVEDTALKEILNKLATKAALPPASVQQGRSTIRTLFKSGIEPQVLIIDFSTFSNFLNEVKSILLFCAANTRVIVIGKEDHISLYRELKHMGVMDYLTLPIQEEVLQEAISQTIHAPISARTKEAAAKLKPFTVVLGTRGGVGASTLCVNVGWLLAMEYQKKVCLLDLDFYHGSICILLDLMQNAGLNDALTEVERLDDIFLKRLLLQKEENFSVLSGQIPLDQEIKFSPDAIQILISLLKDKYDYIYADLPTLFNNELSQTVLHHVDSAVIVTDLSMVSVQDILRLKSYLATHVPNVKYKIVINNIFPHGGTLSKSMFEKAIETPIDMTLPYCKASMLEGMNTGEPFVKMGKDHAYAQSLRKFIQMLYPQLKKNESKSSWLKKWWR